MTLFGLEHLLDSEEQTSVITSEYLNGITVNYPRIIDCFFKLSYFTGQLESTSSTNGEVQSACKITYLQAPYTFWSLYGLYEKGYYFEAIIIFRHLIEAFIQLRYFHKFPNKLREHVLQTKRINFSAMFNEFSPGYYQRIYSRQLSEAAHGLFFIKNLHRVERSEEDNSKSRTIMGCEFSEDRATYIMNMAIPLIHGYFYWFDKFFPSNTITQDESVYAELLYALDWTRKSMDAHKKAHPRSQSFFAHMDKFIF